MKKCVLPPPLSAFFSLPLLLSGSFVANKLKMHRLEPISLIYQVSAKLYIPSANLHLPGGLNLLIAGSCKQI